MSNQRIGIFGGSFNPIHNGHLALGKAVCDQLALDQLVFMPAGYPPHKPHGNLAPGVHRHAMLKLAVEQDPRFTVSTQELETQGTTYTVNTLKALRSMLDEPYELFFVMGADSLVDLVNWRAFNELVTLCTFVAAARPGIPREAMLSQKKFLEESHHAKIEIVEMTLMDISSSEIRRRVACREDIVNMVPEAVLSYIVRNGLYGGIENDNQRA